MLYSFLNVSLASRPSLLKDVVIGVDIIVVSCFDYLSFERLRETDLLVFEDLELKLLEDVSLAI